MSEPTKSSLFKARVPARDKAEHTTFVARSIIDAEAAQREKKTARLRELRLQHEAELAAAKPPRPKAGPATAKPVAKQAASKTAASKPVAAKAAPKPAKKSPAKATARKK